MAHVDGSRPVCPGNFRKSKLTHYPPEKIARDAAKLGWDLPALERQNRLKIIFTTRSVFRQELQQADSLLLDEAAKMGARRIFVDGVAGVIGGVNGQEPREAFQVPVEGLNRENLTAVLALEASVLNGDRPAALPEESIADTVIRLRRFQARFLLVSWLALAAG